MNYITNISQWKYLSLGRYISPWGYHPPSSQSFGNDIVY